MVDSFLRNLEPVRSTPVVYFYAKCGQDPTGVLRDLVRQLVLTQPDPKKFFDQHPDNGGQLSYQDCTRHITDLIKSHESVVMVIDAVDECRPQPSAPRAALASHTFLQMLSDLSAMMRNSNRPVKLFISSQNPHDGIEAFYQELRESKAVPCFETSADEQPRTDMQRFIAYEVNSWPRSQFLPKEHNQEKVKEVKLAIIKAVTRKAGRM